MTAQPIRVTAPAPIDRVVPFQIDALDVRGRVVRLGPALNAVLGDHGYPPVIASLVAEALVLSSLIGAVLTEDGGQVTLQARGDGPVSLLVSDFQLPGAVRGYAEFDRDAISALPVDAPLERLFRKSALAITIDQPVPGAPPGSGRYQGIVELRGADLAQAAQGYFEDSQQIPTLLRIAVRYDPVAQSWIAGGLLLQHLPKGEVGGARHFASDSAPAWEHARTLGATIRPDELSDPDLPLPDLLYRLFHEEDCVTFPDVVLERGCRCSRERIQSVLRQFSFDQLMDMREDDGSIRVHCAFCSKDWVFERPQEREG
jgi:molecular chaperone Hsp33